LTFTKVEECIIAYPFMSYVTFPELSVIALGMVYELCKLLEAELDISTSHKREISIRGYSRPRENGFGRSRPISIKIWKYDRVINVSGGVDESIQILLQ